MQKSDVFFKDFKTSFIVAGLAFTVFFAMAIFFELAMGAISVSYTHLTLPTSDLV